MKAGLKKKEIFRQNVLEHTAAYAEKKHVFKEGRLLDFSKGVLQIFALMLEFQGCLYLFTGTDIH